MRYHLSIIIHKVDESRFWLVEVNKESAEEKKCELGRVEIRYERWRALRAPSGLRPARKHL